MAIIILDEQSTSVDVAESPYSSSSDLERVLEECVAFSFDVEEVMLVEQGICGRKAHFDSQW